MLNEYFAVITEAAYQHDGTIFNMAGDSLLVGIQRAVPAARRLGARAGAPPRTW